MTLKDNLPVFITKERRIKEVLDAIQPEIDKIRTDIGNLLLECCISTCSSEGIKRFEEDYKIGYNASFSIEERRKRVISKMLAKKKLNKVELENLILRIIDGGQYYITNLAEQYEFKVMILDKAYKNKLYDAIFNARPAHLNFSVTLVSYQRRCGTFRTNEKTI